METTPNSSLPEYSIWCGMRQRCLNPNANGYKDYGGRGVTICDRWSTFELFLADIGPRPSPKHSLDRIDVNLNYTPDNVRWADYYTQARNKRNNHWITYEGETLCLADWAKRYKLTTKVLSLHLWAGWSIKNALTLDWEEVDLYTELKLNLREDLSPEDEKRLKKARLAEKAEWGIDEAKSKAMDDEIYLEEAYKLCPDRKWTARTVKTYCLKMRAKQKVENIARRKLVLSKVAVRKKEVIEQGLTWDARTESNLFWSFWNELKAATKTAETSPPLPARAPTVFDSPAPPWVSQVSGIAPAPRQAPVSPLPGEPMASNQA